MQKIQLHALVINQLQHVKSEHTICAANGNTSTDQTGMQCFLEYRPKSTMVQECKGILHGERYMNYMH